MDELEDNWETYYTELKKVRNGEIHYLYEKLLRKYCIVDIEDLVDQSILNASYTYDEKNVASLKTYFRVILRNSTLNYLRDKGKYDLTSINEIFGNVKGDLEVKSKVQYFDEKFEKEKNQKMEIAKKYFLKFIDEDLEGIDKTVANALVNIVYGRGDINFREIAEDYKIDDKRIYKIKEKIERKLLAFIKKLPGDTRKIFRKITFEPKPGEPTEFAYLKDSIPVVEYKDNKEISTFEKLISLLFAYQNNKFNNFINNNISDVQFKLIYSQFR